MRASKTMMWSVVGAIALIGAQTAHAQDAITLALKPKAKETRTYQTTINASVMGTEAVVKAKLKRTIKEVKDNGDFVVDNAAEAGTVSIGGMEQDAPAQAPFTLTISKYGKVVSFKASEESAGFMAPEIQNATALLGSLILPEKAVKAGDTWTTEYDNPAVKGKKFTVKTTFIGTDKVGDKEYWKLKQSADVVVDGEGAKMAYEETTWLDPSNGNLFKSESTVKDLPTQFGPISWSMKTELVKEAAAK